MRLNEFQYVRLKKLKSWSKIIPKFWTDLKTDLH